jgi:hypothetical protein
MDILKLTVDFYVSTSKVHYPHRNDLKGFK